MAAQQRKGVSPVKAFLMKLAGDLTTEDFQKMIFVSDLSEAESDKCLSKEDKFGFFNILLRREDITIDPLNLDLLVEMLQECNNLRLSTKVIDFVAQQRVSADDPNTPGSQRDQSKLHHSLSNPVVSSSSACIRDQLSGSNNQISSIANPESSSKASLTRLSVSDVNPILQQSSSNTDSRTQYTAANLPIAQPTNDEQVADTNSSGINSLGSESDPSASETILKTPLDSPDSNHITTSEAEDVHEDGTKQVCVEPGGNKAMTISDIECDGPLNAISKGPSFLEATTMSSSPFTNNNKDETISVPYKSMSTNRINLYRRDDVKPVLLDVKPVHSTSCSLNLFPEIPDSSFEDNTDSDYGSFHLSPKSLKALSQMSNQKGTYSLLKERMNRAPTQLVAAKDLVKLHDYQIELAQPGVTGENCIICAPTGSGKTFTAAYICLKRMEKVRESCPIRVDKGESRVRFNALFVVCIRNLIQQQRDAICKVITEENVVISINETTLLSEAMKRGNVTVLTAQILVNCLENKEVNISDFDLIIMDECHHTDLKHPYNQLMKFYHEAQWSDQGIHLPQIVGLTASLGVGSAAGDDPEGTLLHYIKLCANLNSRCITHVKEERHIEELLKYNPRPKKEQIITVNPRPFNSSFSTTVSNIMSEIIESISMPEAPCARGTQQYENFIVERRREAESIGLIDMVIMTNALIRFNTALIMFEDLRAKDALSHLISYFNEEYLSADQPTDTRQYVYDLFFKYLPLLQSLADKEKVSDNAKLNQLCRLLTDLFAADCDARGILLTRTRQGVDALVGFISDQDALKDAVYPARLVGQGRKEGAMTDVAQENALRRFRLGRDGSAKDGCNLLVATDVAQEGLDMPKCSFVIRYNFVSNEIGSVQSRGRARARNSECYLIVNKDSINHKREMENLEKEHLMMQALGDIDDMPPELLKTEIEKAQKRIKMEHIKEKGEKNVKMMLCDASNVIIHCRGCLIELCRGNEICRRQSNYICIAKDFIPLKAKYRKGYRQEYRLDSHIGMCHCANPKCEQKLGPEIEYKVGSRSRGHALSKEGVFWRFEGQKEYNAIKKWSKVPFHIEDEPMFGVAAV